MTAEEIARYAPQRFEEDRAKALERARLRMQATGQWSPRQHLGRRSPVGCVALEITQRCNLDCELCYLSESSQALKDVPLEEVVRRISMIRTQYGEGTDADHRRRADAAPARGTACDRSTRSGVRPSAVLVHQRHSCKPRAARGTCRCGA